MFLNFKLQTSNFKHLFLVHFHEFSFCFGEYPLVIFRENFDEILQLVFEIIQYKFCNSTTCISVMAKDHVLKMPYIFLCQWIQVYHFLVAITEEISFHIVYKSKSSAHTSRKIPTCVSEDHHCSTSHVFTTMIT